MMTCRNISNPKPSNNNPEIILKLKMAYSNIVRSGRYDKIMMPFKHSLSTQVYHKEAQ